MKSMQAQQLSWAEIVKGKQAVEAKMAPEAGGFHFDPKAPEFALTLETPPKLNAAAKEFDPSQGQLLQHAAKMQSLLQECCSDSSDDETPPKLNAAAKEFDPSQGHLLQHAAKMQSLLLECYSDSSDDETPCTFRAPPGLAPPGVAAVALNPFAKEFAPSAESKHTTQRARTARKRVSAQKGATAPPITTFKVPASAALNASAPEFSPSSAFIDQKPAESHACNINFACYSSDDESPCTSPRTRVASKVALVVDSDSTSEGKTSDSDAESLNGSDTL